jgi:hypothetical protein
VRIEEFGRPNNKPWEDPRIRVAPTIASLCSAWHRNLSETDRNRLLVPLLPEIAGTITSDEDEETRAWMAADWEVRTHAPLWLDAVIGLESHAKALRSLSPITTVDVAELVQPIIDVVAEGASSHALRRITYPIADIVVSTASNIASDALGATGSYAARCAMESAARVSSRSIIRGDGDRAAHNAAWHLALEALSGLAPNAPALDLENAARRALAWTIPDIQPATVTLIRAMCAVGR